MAFASGKVFVPIGSHAAPARDRGGDVVRDAVAADDVTEREEDLVAVRAVPGGPHTPLLGLGIVVQIYLLYRFFLF